MWWFDVHCERHSLHVVNTPITSHIYTLFLANFNYSIQCYQLQSPCFTFDFQNLAEGLYLSHPVPVSPNPQSLATTFLLCFYEFAFFDCTYIYMWDCTVFVFVWVISLSKMPSRFIHVVSSGFLSFMYTIIFHCTQIYSIFFLPIHLLTDA